MSRCLGKAPPRVDPRTLQLAAYLDARAIPAPPPARDWTHAASPRWGLMANDRLGDCTCAAAGHLIQTWTANNGAEVTPSDADIVKAYEAVGHYNPAYPDTDQGAVELDVLNYWRSSGIAGHKIGAFVAVSPGNKTHVEAAINLFGGVYIGAALPLSAQHQTVWDVAEGPDAKAGSWGGHAMACVGYNRTGVVLITWGAIKVATWAWWEAYTDEAYALLDAEWVDASRPAPNGFNLDALRVDLAALKR